MRKTKAKKREWTIRGTATVEIEAVIPAVDEKRARAIFQVLAHRLTIPERLTLRNHRGRRVRFDGVADAYLAGPVEIESADEKERY